MFLDACGWTGAFDAAEEVAAVQEESNRLVRALAAQGRGPQATWVADGLIDEFDARVTWTRANRHLVVHP